ncbi:hypothetical protein AB6805_14895 [Chitinophaga sp. RCC_12]|uniref:hypothetical protein n=1 Tax=Chitinophaga sp. RCC_12 TaxID=3239226 RepID=UPI003524DFF1
MKDKIIVVPKDKTAKDALIYNTATSEQLIEVTLNEMEYKELWDTGFFDLINNIAGINIDDFEDEGIEDVGRLKKVLTSGIFATNAVGKVNQIKSLFEEAVKRKTGIYFYF